ncbi:MAG: cytidylate kinase-like family protein [Pseudomonadota bacterium]
MVSKLRSKIEAQLAHQSKLRTEELWKERKGEKKLPFITISREFGCRIYPLVEVLQDKLNRLTDKQYPWAVFDREVINRIAEEHNLSEALANSLDKNQRSQMEQYMDHIFFNRPNEYKIFQYLTRTLIGLAEKGNAILIGRGGCIITRNVEKGLHVRLIAPFEYRKEKIRQEMDTSEPEAAKLVKKTEKEREAFVEKYTLQSIKDPYNFHLILNHELYSADEIVDIIIHNLKIKGYV